VKQISANDQAVIFQITARERDVLMQILQSYPVVPPAHQAVSKELKEPRVTEYQRLLDEALAEQRAANKSHLQAWLAAPERFPKGKTGYRFTLERSDSEWLLQVLNDIRVGHWLRLGSPEIATLKPKGIDPKLFPSCIAMELSGYFQMCILEALAG
jgi:hypothetical protein